MARDGSMILFNASHGQQSLHLPESLIVDNFAGGGGASTGIELALGRPVDIAINHDPQALGMHHINHPWTDHYCESVWDVNPCEVCNGRPVLLAHFSPDCKHHSKAKGGKPLNKNIRGLAWVAIRWAATVKPSIITLENVEEFADWGPLDSNGRHRQRQRKPTTPRPEDSRMSQTLHRSITGGVTHLGLTVDQIDQDISTLIDGKHLTEKELHAICSAIQETAANVDNLHHLIGDYLPKNNKGDLPAARGGLLTMLIDIQRTANAFNGGIDVVRKRIEANLRRRAKAQAEAAQEEHEKSGIHEQEALL
jgi:hypothetical protein